MITVNLHNATKAKADKLEGTKGGTLKFYTADGPLDQRVTMFVPRHVAQHTAEAFNRAMQAVETETGWEYTGKSGVWNIARIDGPYTVYHAQHEEVTGDGDPSWMFTDARSLMGCLDAIDEVEAENCCDRCNELVGGDNLRDCDPQYLCDSCYYDLNDEWQASREMAEDDKAHAEMDRRAGL